MIGGKCNLTTRTLRIMSRRCGREKIHSTVSFGFLNLRACYRGEA